MEDQFPYSSFILSHTEEELWNKYFLEYKDQGMTDDQASSMADSEMRRYHGVCY